MIFSRLLIESLDTPISKNKERVIVQLSDIDENLKFIFRFRMMINAAHDYRVFINRNYEYEIEMASFTTYFSHRFILYENDLRMSLS